MKSWKAAARHASTAAFAMLMLGPAAVVVQAATTAPAQAYTRLGCRFQGASPLYYERGAFVTDRFWNATKAAAARWNAVNVPNNFVVATGSRDGNVVVGEQSFADPTVWASTTGRCNGDGNWHNHQVSLTWATENAGPLTATQKRIVGTHELGHALGLGHVSVGCAGPKAVMVQGRTKFNCGWGTEPWADDINGVNAIY